MGDASAPKLVEVLAQHRFDEARLAAYLKAHLAGFDGAATIRQFQGGQSNPTYLIEASGRRFVLRKQPPGALLPSAHQIDREYRIQTALAPTGVPVAAMLHYCDDATIIGTPFYVMAHVEGRVFHDVMMPDVSAADRAAIQRHLIETIATLHLVDVPAVGLEGFGRPDHYVARQIERWTRQYEASKTADFPAMTQLIDWLRAHQPAQDETSIVHGDFRLGNMVIHQTAPRIVAVLDWELATLGHPLADLAYCCMSYHLPPGSGPAMAGYQGVDLASLGLMTEAEALDLYCARTGRDGIKDWRFFMGFSLFRSAAIVEGVFARSRAGNAADERAGRMHDMFITVATTGWDLVRGA
ncbi:phosphotransferase family protein [Acidiphilium sp.]|uniref:phosphotransferase family protein n=1 Tax=Acidiphilium sp. TaxID=527 RepID=UPI003D0923DC